MNLSQDRRALLLAELLARPSARPALSDPLRPVLASLLVGRSLEQGVLTATLGLAAVDFQSLSDAYFPGDPLTLHDGPGQSVEELDDLRHLLLDYRAGLSDAEIWLASIVAYACCGRNHLWQDLGLAQRAELSTLMGSAFPRLAQLNVGDMKWKKFIYRHYCAREGIYVCPAPSCGACSDYSKCFSSEA